jgi:hypothetical protein
MGDHPAPLSPIRPRPWRDNVSHRPGERPILRTYAEMSPDDAYVHGPDIIIYPSCHCGRLSEPGARFCDACGMPLPATGVTTRL